MNINDLIEAVKFQVSVKPQDDFLREVAEGLEQLCTENRHLRADIEQLKTNPPLSPNNECRNKNTDVAHIKSEAVKEFAEKVKTVICENTVAMFSVEGKPVNVWKAVNGYDAIDDLVKEMVGDCDA